MSTPCKTKISEHYTLQQCFAEIAWLEKEIERVKLLMHRKPSKATHLKDLQRQKQDMLDILERG
jgi:hypothetical protein